MSPPPRWVCVENVFGLLSIEHGMALESMLSALEAEGYEVLPFVIPACGVDAPHRRERVWIVAHASGTGQRPDNGRRPVRDAERDGAGAVRQHEQRQGAGCSSADVAHAEERTERAGLCAGEQAGIGRRRPGNGCGDVADAEKFARRRYMRRTTTLSLSRNAGNARETLPRIARKLDGCQGGQLSPRWECWLMGYPLDWLDLPDGSQSQTSPEPPERRTRQSEQDRGRWGMPWSRNWSRRWGA